MATVQARPAAQASSFSAATFSVAQKLKSPTSRTVQIIGGEYYGNTREGILIKLPDNVTVSGANVHDNMRYGVRIEGSDNTIVRDSFILRNSQELKGKYDEV